MRIVYLLLLALCSTLQGHARQTSSKDETIKYLQSKLTSNNDTAGSKKQHTNYTKMCINYNLVPESEMTDDIKTSKHFKDKVETFVSWKDHEMDVENKIYRKGKLSETYTYQIPLNAIASAAYTNCKINAIGNVNAYVDRPIFVKVKRNSTKIEHHIFDKSGKEITKAGQKIYMNTKEVDWESYIPIAGDWDMHPALQEKMINAFNRLAELSDNKYTTK